MHEPAKWSYIYTGHVKTCSCNIKSHLSGLERVLEKGKIFVYIRVYFSLWLDCGYINGKR